MERIIQNPLMSDAEKITVLENAIMTIKEEGDGLAERVSKHHKILVEGNGELPAMERIRNLESFVNSVKFWLKTIAVAVVLQTISFTIAAFFYFMKLYPVLQQLSKQINP